MQLIEVVGNFGRPVHHITTGYRQVSICQAQSALVRQALARERRSVMQPGTGSSSKTGNAVLLESRQQGVVDLIPGEDYRSKFNPTSFSNPVCTLEVCTKLSITLAGLKAIIVGEGVSPNLLMGAFLDFPDQRWRKVQRVIS